jgi:hypothetical protein
MLTSQGLACWRTGDSIYHRRIQGVCEKKASIDGVSSTLDIEIGEPFVHFVKELETEISEVC